MIQPEAGGDQFRLAFRKNLGRQDQLILVHGGSVQRRNIGVIVGKAQINGDVRIVRRNGISPIVLLVWLQIKFLQYVEKALLILDRHEQDAIRLNDVAVRVQ